MKDHQIAALVNQLRDLALAFHDSQQLREVISSAVNTALTASDETDCPQADRAAAYPKVAGLTEREQFIRNQGYAEGFEARAAASAQATPDDDCKCRRLGDWKGAHHPLCDAATPPSPAAASAHTIGEDAANVAIGEREAFEAWAKDKGYRFNAGDLQSAKSWALAAWMARAAAQQAEPSTGICFFCGEPINGAHESDCPQAASAALTAEKGQEPCEHEWLPMTEPQKECVRCGDVRIDRAAAPQQPAQPVAQTLALTDEQILLIYRAIPGKDVIGNATTVDEMHDRILLAFARALLAAQPASSLAEGGERE